MLESKRSLSHIFALFSLLFCVSCGALLSQGPERQLSHLSETRPDLLGSWFMGGPYHVGLPCRIEADGEGLKVLNENGDQQSAFLVAEDEIVVPGWNNLHGKLQADLWHQLRIDWANGTWWVRHQATMPEPPKGQLCTAEDPDFSNFVPMLAAMCRENLTVDRERQVLQQYRISLNEARYFRVVHYIPLELSGSNQLDNLWPLPLDLAGQWESFLTDLVQSVESGAEAVIEKA